MNFFPADRPKRHSRPIPPEAKKPHALQTLSHHTLSQLGALAVLVVLAACSQLAAEVGQEGAEAELAGLEVSTPAPNELVFSAVNRTASPAQPITVRNTGDAPLKLTEVAFAGPDAAAFVLTAAPRLPLVIQAGDRFTFNVRFTPTEVGALEADLHLASNDPEVGVAEVGLYGLSTLGEGGHDEPALRDVLATLGYEVDVGASGPLLGTGEEPLGDEVPAPLFERAGSGPVTLSPVARYGPEEELPYGYFTLQGGQPERREVARVGAEHAQTLRPPLRSGSVRFDPGGSPFGFYARAGGRLQYSVDGLNTGPTAHAVRVYPLRDRAGTPVADSYLIALEEASNGDYQDAVFVLSNVKPKGAPTETEPSGVDEGWVSLFNGENLDGWYTYLPSKSRNDDPEGIFKAENGTLHILGVRDTGGPRGFGYLATEKEYENYHLRLEYKWGRERFAPREAMKRDSGVIYHATGPDKVWPRGVEYQIQEYDTGDFWLIDGVTLSTTVASRDAEEPRYRENGEPYTSPAGSFVRLVKSDTHDSKVGWNTVEIIVRGDTAVHIINGEVNNRAYDLRAPGSRSLTKGHILLQAEGAEVFYRNIEIRPLGE